LTSSKIRKRLELVSTHLGTSQEKQSVEIVQSNMVDVLKFD